MVAIRRKINDPAGYLEPLQNRNNEIRSPLIFDIARGSFADGPGNRTVVFFKGCPLRCPWCQNPESQLPQAEMYFDSSKCINCGNCREAGGIRPDFDCYTSARRWIGKYYTPTKLARLILRDKIFFQQTGGGVTFSGGEPLLHIDYLYETVGLLKKENIHVAVETCGYFDYDKCEQVLLPYIDLFIFDIKIIDPVKHEAIIGKSNDLILKNFEKLLASKQKVFPRVPLIPGYTATEENLTQIRDFFLKHNIKKFELISYNPSGLDKWQCLSKQPPPGCSRRPLTLEEERKWVETLLS